MSDARKRAADDLGNVIYNIETGELAEAIAQAQEIREALLAKEPPALQLIEGEPGHESCVGCGRPVGALPLEAGKAMDAAVELLYSIRSARKGSIGGIDTHYLPQIGREWLDRIETKIAAGRAALAQEGAPRMSEARKRARIDLAILIQWLDNGHPKQAEQLFGMTGEHARAMAARLRALLAEEPRAPKGLPECTGISASWCPVHGDCTCPRRKDGSWAYRSHKSCPLHSEESNHGDAEVSALAAKAQPLPPLPPEVREAAESVPYWTFQTEWGDGYRPVAALYKTERLADLCREQEVRTGLRAGPVVAVRVPLAALAARRGDA